jgi:hypothetical protein
VIGVDPARQALRNPDEQALFRSRENARVKPDVGRHLEILPLTSKMCKRPPKRLNRLRHGFRLRQGSGGQAGGQALV